MADDHTAEQFTMLQKQMQQHGYQQYEISNFAKPGFESRHNTKYWRLDPVYGFGVSAHSFDGVERYSNERDTANYVEMITRNQKAEVYREGINAASESVFLGLRLNKGIDINEHRSKFGIDLAEKVAELESKELVETVKGRLKLTRRGMLFSNEVFAEFI